MAALVSRATPSRVGIIACTLKVSALMSDSVVVRRRHSRNSSRLRPRIVRGLSSGSFSLTRRSPRSYGSAEIRTVLTTL